MSTDAPPQDLLRAATARASASDQRFALVMQATSSGFWDWDVASDKLYTAGRWKEILGYAAGDIANRSDFEHLVHPDDLPMFATAVAGLLAGTNGDRLVMKTRVRHLDGHYVTVLSRAAVARAPDGTPVQVAGTLLDLSETERITGELHDVERRYDDMIELSPQGFYQLGLDGRVMMGNMAGAKLLGYERPEELTALGNVAEQLYLDPGMRAAFAKELHDKKHIVGFEGRLRRKDGSIIWISTTARAVCDETGAVKYFEGFIEDITARKAAEQMKSDFVSFVTHQLRTPLAGIKWLLELADSPEIPPESLSFITDARASADRLIALVNNLLDVARLEGGRIVVNPEPVDLLEVTASVVRELSPLIDAKHLTVVLPAAADVPRAVLDPKLGAEVVLNLLSNAVRYTADGGIVTVEVRAVNQEVQWTVRDTGIGVPAAAQTRLFEKFFRAANASTADTEGTGLGLYIVRLVVERSGGRVWFESTEGKGSTFHFSAPAAP
jgi:PAS domain S-box-containing protein